ncbi:hypothetical protein C8R46DRAFT_113591 [Mycena filopes]|nr:hypothetical protein C8R46DRAFT_113591 [Mycena filopes]
MASSQCGVDVTRGSPPPPQFDVATPGTRRHILLNSNEVPLEAETAVIEAELRILDDRLLYLDGEILRLQGELEQLEADDEITRLRGRGELEQLEKERASVSEYRALNISVISPLRRVPPEILGHIFFLALPPLDEVLRTEVRVKECPWSLSHVSRYWRAVALSNASLWSLVALTWNSVNENPVYPLPMAETQVARAKTLKIHFYGSVVSNPPAQIEMFRFLAQHAPQWEELSIGLTRQLAPLLAALRDRVPLLRRFSLHWSHWRVREELTIDRVDCFENAPSLVGAWVSVDFRHVPVLFPLHRLTRYQLYSPFWKTHAAILKQTPNLVDVRISVLSDDGSWDNPESHEIIHMPCLRRLYVSRAEILNVLRFPALEEATISCSKNEGPNIRGALQSAISRSSCFLRRLCFFGLPRPSSVTKILNQFPSIVDLALLICKPSDNRLGKTLMKRLTITANGAVVAPQLRHISVGWDDDEPFSPRRVYLDMLTSRCRAGGFVGSELLVASGTYPIPVVLHEIETLRKEGFNLVYFQGLEAEAALLDWTFHAEWT